MPYFFIKVFLPILWAKLILKIGFIETKTIQLKKKEKKKFTLAKIQFSINFPN